MALDFGFTVVMVLLPFIIFAAFLFGAYFMSPKYKAAMRGRHVLRIHDPSGGEYETTVDYKPGSGLVRWRGQAWRVRDEDISRGKAFPFVPIITLSAAWNSSLRLSDAQVEEIKGDVGHPSSVFLRIPNTGKSQENASAIEAYILSMYAAARAGVVGIVETMRKWLMYILINQLVLDILVGVVLMQLGQLTSDVHSLAVSNQADLLALKIAHGLVANASILNKTV